MTMITPYFLERFKAIVDMEQVLRDHKGDGEALKEAKEMGFSDPCIAYLWEMSEQDVSTSSGRS